MKIVFERCRRVVVAIGVLCAGYIGAVGARAADLDKETYDWERDVLPAIQAAFCVQVVEDHLVPGTYGCSERLADPILAEITTEVEKTSTVQQWYFYRLFDEAARVTGLRTTGADSRSQIAAERQLKEAVARDSRLLSFIMPRVVAVLSSHQALCAGCPSAEYAPGPRKVKLDDVLPYAVLLAWPDQMLSNQTPSMHICAAINGMGQLPDPDLVLAGAAIASVSGNDWAVRRMSRALGRGQHVDEYRTADTDALRIAALRTAVKEILGTDEEFRAAVGNGLLKVGATAGVSCEDCTVASLPFVKADAASAPPAPRKPYELEIGGLSGAEVDALHLCAHELNMTLRGTFSVREFLDILAGAAGLKFRLIGDEHREWRGIKIARWDTSTQKALAWLHNACGLRFASEPGSILVVRSEPDREGKYRCVPGNDSISPN